VATAAKPKADVSATSSSAAATSFSYAAAAGKARKEPRTAAAPKAALAAQQQQQQAAVAQRSMAQQPQSWPVPGGHSTAAGAGPAALPAAPAPAVAEPPAAVQEQVTTAPVPAAPAPSVPAPASTPAAPAPAAEQEGEEPLAAGVAGEVPRCTSVTPPISDAGAWVFCLQSEAMLSLATPCADCLQDWSTSRHAYIDHDSMCLQAHRPLMR
jgi:hypothetical protein